MAREPQNGRIGGGVLQDNLKIYQDNSGKDYLNFKNESADTALLHLDPINNRVGITTEAPTRDLLVPTKIKSIGGNTDRLELPNYTLENSIIRNELNETIYLSSANKIKLSALATDQLLIDDDRITTSESNANIDLIPNGTGTVEVQNELRVYGNIETTGDITLDGDLIFGEGPETPDLVAFDKEINSDILLDVTDTWALGSDRKYWANLWSTYLNGAAVRTRDLSIGPDRLTLRQGNKVYVAINGDDTNAGDHQQGPFRTIKRALEFADSSPGQQVEIEIFPGEYEEEFPLTVPSNTIINGHGIRSVSIKPTSGTLASDCFLLTGETTVQNLTIKDFFYDSLNNTGHAFRFASGAVVTNRSPYIQNVTVITQGSITTGDDPRGYSQGDAGRGAYIDGAEVDFASRNASMLFHSATFITPGVDAITMTNGVRVEWLNSFTYFANRGLYAVRGATGHLSEDGSTMMYGAEIRSIGSANVYGNIGAEADGDDCIMYLINHNFAYIGSGRFVDNDTTRVDHTKEAIQINNGKVFYQSTDERGTFKVGESFFVNLENGLTSIDASQVDFDGLSQITVSDGNDETIIGVNYVETGNIRFDGNTVFSLDGDLNIDTATNDINFLTNVSILKDLAVSNDVNIQGALITFGNEPTDTLKFNTPISQNLVPDVNSSYNLGSPTKKWSVRIDDSQIDDIKFKDNYITTTSSNSDLEFITNGVGTVNFQNVTFNADTISTVDSDLILSTPSNLRIDADKFVLPKGDNDERIDGEGDLRFNTEDNIFEGYSTSNIGIGGIFSDDRLTSITAHPTDNTINIAVNGDSVGQVNSLGLEIHGLAGDSILFDGATISTIDSNADLDIRRNGTGSVYLDGKEYFRNNIWTNTDTVGAIELSATDKGYVKVGGTFGTVVPSNGTYTLEDTADVALGQSLAGASIITTVTSGVTVTDPGTGTGTGGFDTYRHYLFTGANTRSIVSATYDLTDFIGGAITGKFISGNDTNGKASFRTPRNGKDLELQWSDDGIIWETISVLMFGTQATGFPTWTDFDITLEALPSSFNPATVRFRVVQLDSAEGSFDEVAVAQLSFRYATDTSNNTELGAIRYNVGLALLEVYNGTDWIESTGVEEDPVTEEYMLDRITLWSILLG